MSLIEDVLASFKPAVPAGTRLIVFGSQAGAWEQADLEQITTANHREGRLCTLR